MQPEENKTPAAAGNAPKRLMQNKSHPVKVYMTVLFIVSLLLLAVSFVMQQRNQEALENINASMSTSEDVAELRLDKQKLEFQIQEMEKDMAAANEEKTALAGEKAALERQAQALEWLRQIELAGENDRSKQKELIEAFRKTGLVADLPDESIVEGGTAPAEAYRNLYARVF